MRGIANNLLFFFVSLILGCMGGGTHGSIECYQFNVPKRDLEKAVRQVISSSEVIKQDSIKEYYNDDTTYVTIKVYEENEINDYIFRFGGDSKYWNTSKMSSIFIAYAHNKEGQGGSSGNGGVLWNNVKLRKELTGVFERNFIVKVDKLLKTKHTKCN
jgi:hypothetical protein